MIVSLRGNLIKKTSPKIILDVRGVGYECFISNNTYEILPKINSEVFLEIHHHITENNQSLFGFIDKKEKSLFKMLISINGIGPKTVMPILSSAKSDDIINRIVSGDVSMLKSLPGIGVKTAKRIIIELKDKLTNFKNEDIPQIPQNDIAKDALNALSSLGYSGSSIRNAIDKILINNPKIKIEELIKETLNEAK